MLFHTWAVLLPRWFSFTALRTTRTAPRVVLFLPPSVLPVLPFSTPPPPCSSGGLMTTPHTCLPTLPLVHLPGYCAGKHAFHHTYLPAPHTPHPYVLSYPTPRSRFRTLPPPVLGSSPTGPRFSPPPTSPWFGSPHYLYSGCKPIHADVVDSLYPTWFPPAAAFYQFAMVELRLVLRGRENTRTFFFAP